LRNNFNYNSSWKSPLFTRPQALTTALPPPTPDKVVSLTNVIDSPSTAMVKLSTSPSPSVSYRPKNHYHFQVLYQFLAASICSSKIC
jgi:hypothetical protein